MTKQDYLKALKAHDWTYSYAGGDAYLKGYDSEQALLAAANQDDELKALYKAYSLFIWEGGEEPTIEEEATPATSSYNLQAILWDAWSIARKAAKHFGGAVKAYIGEAMRQAWAKAKATTLAATTRNSKAKAVFYICIDEKTGRNTRLINQPLVDTAFTDKEAAVAALVILQGAFKKPFIKTSPYYRLH